MKLGKCALKCAYAEVRATNYTSTNTFEILHCKRLEIFNRAYSS